MHAWCLTREHPLVTLHAELSPGTDAAAALLAIKKILSSRFKIDHSTIQVEMEGCADESINDSGGC
jgi:cobalt-zinc-cadmium efflux system protein